MGDFYYALSNDLLAFALMQRTGAEWVVKRVTVTNQSITFISGSTAHRNYVNYTYIQERQALTDEQF